LIIFLWGFHFFSKIQRPINRIFTLSPFLATHIVNTKAAEIACRIACKFVGIGINSTTNITVNLKMIRFSRTIFSIVILILFLSVESSNGYSDIDVKLFNQP
jgi:hypothetical protein